MSAFFCTRLCHDYAWDPYNPSLGSLEDVYPQHRYDRYHEHLHPTTILLIYQFRVCSHLLFFSSVISFLFFLLCAFRYCLLVLLLLFIVFFSSPISIPFYLVLVFFLFFYLLFSFQNLRRYFALLLYVIYWSIFLVLPINFYYLSPFFLSLIVQIEFLVPFVISQDMFCSILFWLTWHIGDSSIVQVFPSV